MGKQLYSGVKAAAAEPVEPPIGKIWAQYKKHRSPELRNFLLKRYLPLVKFSADRFRSRLPWDVDVDDLKQAGAFGLIGAIESFDLKRKVKFETYCVPRIRGAMLDELRKMDWVPRLVRSRTAQVEMARGRLRKELGRNPTRCELLQHLGVNDEQFDRIEKDTSPTTIVSLHQQWSDGSSQREVQSLDLLRDHSQSDPQLNAQRRDLKELINKGLSRAEQLVIALYYFENMSMKEIGAVLELSESRVSQMHTSIMARLKARMIRHRWACERPA